MNKILLLLTLVLTTALIFFKLDYRSFFTDELSYYYNGREIVNLNDYSKNKEVPPVGKYLGGISYLIGNRNIFLLRLPFALLSIFSAFVVYLIIKSLKSLFVSFLFGRIFKIVNATGKNITRINEEILVPIESPKSIPEKHAYFKPPFCRYFMKKR